MSVHILSQAKLNTFSEYENHEEVRYIFDQKSGLKCFIAIDNTNLGPAVGGTRMFLYKSEEEALKDVLRLSHAMTYKCAISRVPFGGGKGVIIGNPNSSNKKVILDQYAREVEKLKGKFFTGEDVGISEEDVQNMLKIAPCFIGKSDKAGDPSPYAALSAFHSMQVMVKHVLDKSKLDGISIAVKGIGKVGGVLVKMLVEQGAKVTIADIDQKRVSEFKNLYKSISVVSPTVIHTLNVDVYSPNAMGREFDDESVREIKAKIICGAANNQLAENHVGDLFFTRGIIYGPDYVVNAGGLIDVVDELESGGYQKKRVIQRIERVKDTLADILEVSKRENIPTHRIANGFAESIFNTSSISKSFVLA